MSASDDVEVWDTRHGRRVQWQCKKGHQGSGPREEKESRRTPSALYQHSGHIGTFGRTPQVPVALHCKCTTESERFNPQRLMTGYLCLAYTSESREDGFWGPSLP